jgi:exonuclease SbcD
LVSATDDADPVARYAGSPLAFSFSEINHRKSTALVSVGDGAVGVELVPAPVPRALGEIVGTLDEVLAGATPDLSDRWMRVTLTDAVRPPHLNQQVKRAFPHALVIQHLPATRSGEDGPQAVTAARDPLEVAGEFVQFAGGAEPTTGEASALAAALEAVRHGEGSA